MLFSKDANTLVLKPIERMVKKVREVSENPLKRFEVFEDDDDATVGNEDDRMTERHRAIIRKAEYHCGAFDVPVLTAQELIALREKDDAKVIVVDVRTEAERRVARLPRSVSRCYFEKALRLNADAASLRGVKIVVICTVGRRSGSYARQDFVQELPEHRGPRRADEAEAHALEALGAQVPGPRVDVEPRRRPPLLVDDLHGAHDHPFPEGHTDRIACRDITPAPVIEGVAPDESPRTPEHGVVREYGQPFGSAVLEH